MLGLKQEKPEKEDDVSHLEGSHLDGSKIEGSKRFKKKKKRIISH